MNEDLEKDIRKLNPAPGAAILGPDALVLGHAAAEKLEKALAKAFGSWARWNGWEE